nr:hypothetical protein [Acidiphilium rubrum]
MDAISEAAGPVPRSAVFLLGGVMNGRARSGTIGRPSVNLSLDPRDCLSAKIDRCRELTRPHKATDMHAGPGDTAIFQLLITDEFHLDLRVDGVA